MLMIHDAQLRTRRATMILIASTENHAMKSAED